jgi:hypothetical protein
MSAETTTQPLYVFQVHYRDLTKGGSICYTLVLEETAEDAKAYVSGWLNCEFVAVGKGKRWVDPAKKVLTIEELASVYEVSTKSIERNVGSGDLKPIGGVGSLPWLFPKRSSGLEEAV